MAKVNSLLTQRLKQATEKLSKMTGLAELSSSGNLSSFAGIFRMVPLSAREQDLLQNILSEHSHEEQNIREDLSSLVMITTEVKAINNQAAILHGERIKKAQEILKKYRDGAFSAWLIATYGNRQTPYNFLQYFELYNSLPKMLQPKLDEMPRQAIYVLASRSGSLAKKEEIIKSYQGEPKQELLSRIRISFPLSKEDRRAQDLPDVALRTLRRLHKLVMNEDFYPTHEQKEELQEILGSLLSLTIR